MSSIAEYFRTSIIRPVYSTAQMIASYWVECRSWMQTKIKQNVQNREEMQKYGLSFKGSIEIRILWSYSGNTDTVVVHFCQSVISWYCSFRPLSESACHLCYTLLILWSMVDLHFWIHFKSGLVFLKVFITLTLFSTYGTLIIPVIKMTK